MSERSDAELVKLAAKLMGWKILTCQRGSAEFLDFMESTTWPYLESANEAPAILWTAPYTQGQYWNPVKSISDAWMLVEKSGGMWICPAENGHGWRAGILATEDPNCESGIYADTAPRAITLRFIAAMGK